MADFTKKQKQFIKDLCNDITKQSFKEGWLKGEKSVFKHFIDSSVDGLDQGYKGVKHSAIIKNCNDEIERIDKELSSPKTNKKNSVHEKEVQNTNKENKND